MNERASKVSCFSTCYFLQLSSIKNLLSQVITLIQTFMRMVSVVVAQLVVAEEITVIVQCHVEKGPNKNNNV